MNTEAARQFCHGAFLAQRCQRHLRLELCRMLLPDFRHPVTPSPAAILGAGVSLSHLSSFRGPAQRTHLTAAKIVDTNETISGRSEDEDRPNHGHGAWSYGSHQ